MNKLEFISKQLSKATNKKYEHYAVTRIWHLLNDLDIKFVTQQHVTRPEGRALTDMYFPQFGIHIEIDEPFHINQKELDKLREVDIINATDEKQHKIERIDFSKDIETINARILEIVEIIKRKRKECINEFKKWNLDEEQNPKTFIDKRFIDLKDDCAFNRIVDAANCFGNNYKGYQKGGARHPMEPGKIIWFPKLYENGDWINSISVDEKTITEISKHREVTKDHIDRIKNGKFHNRIVFARVRSPLGDIMYRFKGEYELDFNASNYDGLIWKRVSDRVNTYSPNQ